MIRLFIFNNASRAAGYGIGTYIRQLSGAMSSIPGTDVAFVEMYSDEEEFRIIEDSVGRSHMVIPRPESKMEDEPYCRSVFYLLARHIEANDGDRLIFQFNYFQHLPIALLLKGRYPGCRIVFTVHYLGWCFALNGNIRRFKEILEKDKDDHEEKDAGIIRSFHSEQMFLHLADLVIVLSRRTLELLEETYNVSGDKIRLIYNGSGNSLGKSVPESGRTPKNVVFVGRLDRIKGLGYLIGAFERVADRHPDVMLLITGEGDFEPYLEKSRKIHSRVSFLGKMDGDGLESLYEGAYIGVMPSFHEQCSYTAIEMMRHGIPIIGTDSTGLSEMLDATPQSRVHIDEESFSEGQFIEDLAERLDMLLTDRDLHDGISLILRARYLEMYTADKMAAESRLAMAGSMEKPESICSDYLQHMDRTMIQLIAGSPDISVDFFGMSGIGVYLWWRALCTAGNDPVRHALLMEHLIYFIDWLDEASQTENLPDEMAATLQSMEEHGFYRTAVRRMLSRCSISDAGMKMPDAGIITKNALRICNCRI